ncbi:hypothetical protein C7B69_25270 [filamentous cyanobacterium Phorm 46]|nr:hypothetical protein C7B69_25270 [filamentous cyanobacterium Phorm 46]PSB51558.1 hypothetical protein C7B67_10350 [filamentous cyanobacterium Phorm 6]
MKYPSPVRYLKCLDRRGVKKVQIIEEGRRKKEEGRRKKEEGKTNYRMGLTDITGSLALPGNLYLEALPRWGKRRQSLAYLRYQALPGNE